MRQHLHIFLLGLNLLGVTSVLATPQAGTPFDLNGTNHYVHGFDLRKDMSDTFLHNRGKLPVISTGNYKGYYDRLAVRKNKLYLTGLDIDRPNGLTGIFYRGPSIKTLFGTTVPRSGIFADWFSGELREYFGERLGYIHVQSHERIYSFENGVLKGVREQETKLGKVHRERKASGTTNNVLENTGTNAPDSHH